MTEFGHGFSGQSIDGLERAREIFMQKPYSRYVDLLKEGGVPHRPTLKQVIFGKWIDAVWNRKLNGVYVTPEGEEYEALIYSEDPTGSFPVIIEVPLIDKKVILKNPSGFDEKPNSAEELDICFSVFWHTALRLSEH